MDEVKKFLNILKRFRQVIIVVPVIIIIITYFLVRNLSDSYMSQVQIATGIVDETRQFQKQSILNQGLLPNDQVNQAFSNLITMMRMKKILDQVSYKLIIHDLTTNQPFRKPSKNIEDLNQSARAHALEVYRDLYRKMAPLNLWDNDQNGIYNVLKSVKYDNESLNDRLNIYRSGDSDFIIVEFESEDPELSAFVVNTLSAEFVNYYATVVKTNKIKTTNFLGKLLEEKSDTLAKKMNDLRSYKIENRVLNLDEQSKQLYTSITEYNNKKQEATQNTSSYAGALNEIDRKFSPTERKYMEATLQKVNQDILSLKDELNGMYDLYYSNDLDDKYSSSIDSLKEKLRLKIGESSDKYLVSPLATKQALVAQKVDLEIKLDISRYSINSLEREIARLNAQFDELVPRDAEVQSFAMNIDIATKEYLDILNKYNQSSLESGISEKLNIVQAGMPGLPKPSKKMLIVILSGVLSGMFVLVILFIMFLLDGSIISTEQLAYKTELPIIGTISLLNIRSVDLKEIWKASTLSPAELQLKNQLRSIRYEIENDLKGKIVAVTSICPKQGKTFITMSLALAWVMTNKKVLVIDGNFSNPTVSEHVNSTIFIEDFLQGNSEVPIPSNDSSLVILKNKGGDTSLIEIAGYEQIIEKLNLARETFDLILIETASMDKINQAKEWISFTENIVGIFKYGEVIERQHEPYVIYLKQSGLFRGWVMNQTTPKV